MGGPVHKVGHDPETGKAIIKMSSARHRQKSRKAVKKGHRGKTSVSTTGRARNCTVGSWLEVWMENYAKLNCVHRPTKLGFLKNHIKSQIGGILAGRPDLLDLQRFCYIC